MDPKRHHALTGAALAIAVLTALASSAPAFAQPPAQIPLAGKAVPKYVEPLPMPLRIDVTNTTAASPIELSMNEFQQKLLPNSFYAALPAPFNAGTYLWCYKAAGWPQTFPGPTLEARVGVPTHVKWVNNLQGPDGETPQLMQYLTVDQTLHWADPLMTHNDPVIRFQDYNGPIPAAPHLHGGEVPSAFDGGPDHWWTPDFQYKGVGFVTDQYVYPNAQQATTLWYHDHALGITRLNVIAGLAGFYLLRDAGGLEPANLPGGPLDGGADQYGNVYEREVVFQDRLFDTNGQVIVPALGDNPTLHPFWIPEYFGDIILVNGKTWPYLNVEPRRYRFRFLNGSNARVYVMWLEEPVTLAPGPAFWQIGAEGGLLDAPAKYNDPASAAPLRLTMMPGERADLVIDFSGYAGKTLVLRNSGRAPFPKGATVDPQTTGQLLQFRVGTTVTGGADPTLDPATTLSLRSKPIERPVAGTTVRALTLNEVMGPLGPLEALLNNDMWFNGCTENLKAGDTEVWEIINLTGDAHPIHPHLVQAQVLNRQRFSLGRYLKVYGMPMDGMGPPLPYDTPSALTGGKLGGNPDVTKYLQGAPIPPEPNEMGWKDTFRANPGEVLRLLVRVAPQDANERAMRAGSPVGPGYNYYDFDPWTPIGMTDSKGYPGGPGYVWHCHILEHEDNEMMRPLRVLDPGLAPAPAALKPATEETAVKPAQALALAVPNPVNGATFMRFSLPSTGPVRIELFDVAGKRVQTLASGTFTAGSHVLEWDGRGADGARVASGTYFVRLAMDERMVVKRFAMVH